MAGSLRRAPAREDASHSPPLMTRPLTLRAWPAATSVNDNHASELTLTESAKRDIVDWEVLCAPTPIIVAQPSSPKHRVTLRDAAWGLAGAFAIVVAVLCLIAR